MEHFRWQLTISENSHIVRVTIAWCVYESTGFHLGNIGQGHSGKVRMSPIKELSSG